MSSAAYRNHHTDPTNDPHPFNPAYPVSFLLDIAGQDESRLAISPDDDSPLQNPGRDATTLSVASIDLSTLSTLHAPTYRIIHRRQWLGLSHLVIFGQLKNLVETWKPNHIVIDATAVGEGLWALLDRAFPARVIPVKFTAQEKSDIGWRFLAIIETGRFRDCTGSLASGQAAQCPSYDGWTPPDLVRLQYTHCRSQVLPGPGKLLRWGVPEGTRGSDGGLIHDDHLLADSLVAKLDTLPWYEPSHSFFVSLPTPPGLSSHVGF